MPGPPTQTCPFCQAEIPRESAACRHCRGWIHTVCATCGGPAPRGALACPACLALRAAPQVPGRPSRVARTLSVYAFVFAGLQALDLLALLAATREDLGDPLDLGDPGGALLRIAALGVLLWILQGVLFRIASRNLNLVALAFLALMGLAGSLAPAMTRDLSLRILPAVAAQAIPLAGALYCLVQGFSWRARLQEPSGPAPGAPEPAPPHAFPTAPPVRAVSLPPLEAFVPLLLGWAVALLAGFALTLAFRNLPAWAAPMLVCLIAPALAHGPLRVLLPGPAPEPVRPPSRKEAAPLPGSPAPDRGPDPARDPALPGQPPPAPTVLRRRASRTLAVGTRPRRHGG